MDASQFLLLLLVLNSAVFGLLGAWVAGEKGRDHITGFILGAAFSIFGVIVLLCLPTIPRPGSRPRSRRNPPEDVSWLQELEGDRPETPHEKWLRDLGGRN